MGKKIFDSYKQLKESGVKLDWDKIGYIELREMWWYESKPDSIIADLFDISPLEVERKRHSFGIKQQNMAHQAFWDDIRDRMKKIDYDEQFKPCDNSERVQKIYSEIKELTPQEIKALILTGKTNVFADFYNAANFGHRLATALEQRGGWIK